MITQISISDFIICNNANIDVSKGFTALTGETGAGKSIILDALALALGSRANYSHIMNGKKQATISVGFDVSRYTKVLKWLEYNGFEHDGQVVIKRILKSSKTSRSLLNGEPISSTQLKELGGCLVSIYAQHSHHQLMKKESGLAIIDSCISDHEAYIDVKETYSLYKKVTDELEATNAELASMRMQQELNEFYLNELVELGLADGEYAQMKIDFMQSSNREHIITSIGQAVSSMDNDELSVVSALGEAKKRVEGILELNPKFAEVIAMLEDATINIEESLSVLSNTIDSYDDGDIDIDSLGQRLSKAESLAKKHKVEPEKLIEIQAHFEHSVHGFDELTDKIENLKEKQQISLEEFRVASAKLHAVRLGVSETLKQELEQMMPGLGLETAQISFELLTTDIPRSSGLSSCEIYFCANKGMTPEKLSQSASGGELSRVSLCLQVAISKRSLLPTMIFDEVDVGIGGSSAEKVGFMLRELGSNAQVISITHQPSVAALSNNHLLVIKDNSGEHVSNTISVLREDQREKEIARMLSGKPDSEESLTLARQLLNAHELADAVI
nr:DNA repair protein RecN [Vibrio splendidus]MCC4880406.1 DNA repair protein RecN [Vibrio splendidus]